MTQFRQSPPGEAVARVIIDTDLPHLDRLFDYRIPRQAQLEVGMMVRVKMANRRYNGWVVEIADRSDFSGRLLPIENIITSIPVLTPTMLGLARDLAARHAVPVAKIISAMIPDRHAGAEKAYFASLTSSTRTTPQPLTVEPPHSQAWVPYRMAEALLRRLSAGDAPRAVWQLTPGIFPPNIDNHPLINIVASVLESGRRALIIVPTANDVDRFEQIMNSLGPSARVAYQRASDSKYARYATFLGALIGTIDVIIGTRSSIYAPLDALGVIVIFDPGDDRLQDPQAPYLSAIDIGVRRAYRENCSLILAAMSISISAATLVRAGWAALVQPSIEEFRALTAVVHIPDDDDRLRDGSGGLGRIPTHVQQRIRRALEEGPVLVHVPHRGWHSVIACDRCYSPARCDVCYGPLRSDAHHHVSCAWCARPQVDWRCEECANKTWKAIRVGSSRTSEELGRIFAGVPIATSDAEHSIVDRVNNKRRLVIATPGSEPVAEDGYVAGLVLDAQAITGRSELWAPEEAFRRWMNVLGLIQPSGTLTIVGVDDGRMEQALIRRDPMSFAQQLLDEREVLGFFPAQCLIAVDGSRPQVEDFMAELALPSRCELLGMASRVGRDVQKSHGSDPVRALYRCHWDASDALIEQIQATQVARSAKRAGAVTVRINPNQLL
ncbi:MAG: hypothetical protein Q4P05_03795 [Actinomycetaceae bacterium]|nr:hypothetical protein [Actinomycetaceae bacterium]